MIQITCEIEFAKFNSRLGPLFKFHFNFTLNPLLHYSLIQEPRNLSTFGFMSRAVRPLQKKTTRRYPDPQGVPQTKKKGIAACGSSGVLSGNARARIEFGKFDFASDLDHCRYYLRRFSTTSCNVLFVTGMFDLFTGVRPVRQARFFWLRSP